VNRLAGKVEHAGDGTEARILELDDELGNGIGVKALRRVRENEQLVARVPNRCIERGRLAARCIARRRP
jgi:hypothetical protein